MNPMALPFVICKPYQNQVYFKKNVSHNLSSNRNMKGQMPSKKDIYHSQGIDKKIWAKCIMKGMFVRSNVPILKIMILFMETHKCVFIMIQIVLVIWVIANPHHVMFSYWEMVLLIGTTRSKPLLLCCQHKLNIWQLHKQ
jgi:hypothetical protein